MPGTATPLPEVAPAPGSPAQRVPGRPRARRWIAAAAVVVSAVAAVVLASPSPPLASPGPVLADGPAVTRLADLGERGSVVVLYEDGGEVAYAFPLRNDGWLPVEVTGVELDRAEDHPLLVPAGLHVATTDPAADTVGALVAAPFTPFTLAPGASRTIVVRGHLANCEYYTERGLHLVDAHTVHTRTFGVTGSHEVTLADDVVVRSPTIQRCPDRVMDRSARRR